MKILNILLLFISLGSFAQYAPQADAEGTTAVYKDSSVIVSWATAYENYIVGEEVDETWQTPEKALGYAQGTSGDIVCLGRGGSITFKFDTLIVNAEGADFVTFENAYSHTFLELGWVEVSMDGINFERFPNHSLSSSSVGAFGDIDPTKINGYCSKYRQAYGTPFDLDSVSIDTIRFVRLIDIVGDGTAYDSDGHVIYDPYPTTGSAGLDIDAIGVIHAGTMQEGINEITIQGFRIYPNPANTFVQIESLNSKVKSCEIFDVTGKLVQQIDLRSLNFRISITDYPEGLYFIKIKTDRESLTKKIIVRR